jgi:cation transport regulator ChaC
MGSFRPFTDMWGWKAYGMLLWKAAELEERRRQAALKGWRTRRKNAKARR